MDSGSDQVGLSAGEASLAWAAEGAFYKGDGGVNGFPEGGSL